MTLPITTLSPKRERLLLWLLAFTQFTVIMDFMVMMPLAPQLMRAFSVGTGAVSGAVSAYAWCAGLSGLFAATYIDRFDRKRLLLTVFCLFALSNLACALAPSFDVLLLSRAFAGLSGGIMGSIVMAVIADVIPAERRGAAAGIVMTSFGMAAVAGVPTGILLAAHFNWAAPFYVLVLASAVIWAGAWIVMPRLDAHLAAEPRPFSSVLPDLLGLFAVARQRRAFLLTGLTMMSGMMVVPFIAPVMVGNLGVQPVQMSWVYLCGGLATLFSARVVGRWTDRIGPARTFAIAASVSVLPILMLTHLPALPLALIIPVFVLFMVANSSRIIPLQALLTTVPAPARRGAFLSVNAAVQQLGSGLGAWIGGLVLSTDAVGHIAHYGISGWLAAAIAVGAVLLVRTVRPTEAVVVP